jgi:hypothetical protein
MPVASLVEERDEVLARAPEDLTWRARSSRSPSGIVLEPLGHVAEDVVERAGLAARRP